MPKPSRRPARSRPKPKRPVARNGTGLRAQGGPGPGEKHPEGGREESQRAGRPGGGTRTNSTRAKPPGRAPRRADMLDMEDTLKARELFWANVVREILCSLAEATQHAAEERARREQEASRPSAPISPEALMAPPGPGEAPGPGEDGQGHPDVLDGRICVITTFGERIPIAEVKPLFAMGVDQSAQTRALSVAVECSVFQIRTPKGMVFTIPIHEIRSVRAVTEELMTEIERERGEGGPDRAPFGFAAFTSMARSGLGTGEVPAPWPEEQESHWE